MSFLEEVRRSTSGALDKAKTALTRKPTVDEEEASQTSQVSDRLEELSEYCPTLTFQQV
jgi:hypothetical protein